ncbi:hypothetical protein CC80DRAFT_597029 [Byssothecium circinans]|uniref:F-box domain-containing protein n=1 Tax=Byssothecium circinans TaxID=147558 RepID=A0A6A5TM00_9PLEO|nr:hypothetical protein CC80DRAFT_597029 [Byssothecium circinans]
MANPLADIKLSSTAIAHRKTCPLHKDGSLRCHAMTRYKLKCSRGATTFSSGYLPTCTQHASQKIRAGRCEAIETCGQRCGCITLYDPPFHLCPKHQEGTDTLPCYLLKIPTELRFMIYRYLFPERIPSLRSYWLPWKEVGFFTSILKINRQISEEAFSVLYNQVPFQITIGPRGVDFCDNTWYCDPPTVKTLWHFEHKMDKIFPSLAVQRAQNFDVDICIDFDGGHWRESPIGIGGSGGSQSISFEDYWLYQARNTIEKFVELLRQTDKRDDGNIMLIQRLRLTPKFDVAFKDSGLEEMLAIVTLLADPFTALSRVHHPELLPAMARGANGLEPMLELRGEKNDPNVDTYKKKFLEYQAHWQLLLAQEQGMPPQGNALILSSKTAQAKALLSKIEEFLLATYKLDLPALHHHNYAADDTFVGLGRVMHCARVAYENRSISHLTKVRDVITDRWIAYQRMKQQEHARIADAVLDMYPKENATLLQTQNAEAFVFPGKKTDTVLNASWDELGVKRYNRIPRGDGWTATEDWTHRYYQKENILTIRLKTPALIQKLRKSEPWV